MMTLKKFFLDRPDYSRAGVIILVCILVILASMSAFVMYPFLVNACNQNSSYYLSPPDCKSEENLAAMLPFGFLGLIGYLGLYVWGVHWAKKHPDTVGNSPRNAPA